LAEQPGLTCGSSAPAIGYLGSARNHRGRRPRPPPRPPAARPVHAGVWTCPHETSPPRRQTQPMARAGPAAPIRASGVS